MKKQIPKNAPISKKEKKETSSSKNENGKNRPKNGNRSARGNVGGGSKTKLPKKVSKPKPLKSKARPVKPLSVRHIVRKKIKTLRDKQDKLVLTMLEAPVKDNIIRVAKELEKWDNVIIELEKIRWL